MDDTFTLFFSSDHADKFKNYFSSKHPNINFSKEIERNGCLSSLDDTFFVKKRDLQLTSIKKDLQWGFIPTSKVLYFGVLV